jgi:hypothetical protein
MSLYPTKYYDLLYLEYCEKCEHLFDESNHCEGCIPQIPSLYKPKSLKKEILPPKSAIYATEPKPKSDWANKPVRGE